MAKTLAAAAAQMHSPPKRGVYIVRLADCPRNTIDTGMDAGPEAEAVARDRYMAWLGLTKQPGRVPEVKLCDA